MFLETRAKKKEITGCDKFDSWDENLYSVSDVKEIISDIKKDIETLENNPDHQSVAVLIDGFDTNCFGSKLSKEQEFELKKKRIPVAIDFYRRFIHRMEEMIELENTDMIAFDGP